MNDVHTGPAEVKERLGIEPGADARLPGAHRRRDRQRRQGAGHRPEDGRRSCIAPVRRRGALLARLDEVKKPKIREALEPHRESAACGRKQLVTFKHGPAAGRRRIDDLARRPIARRARRGSSSPSWSSSSCCRRCRPQRRRRRCRSTPRRRWSTPRRRCGRSPTPSRAAGRLALIPALRGPALRRAAGGPGAGAAGRADVLRAAGPPGARRGQLGPRRLPRGCSGRCSRTRR